MNKKEIFAELGCLNGGIFNMESSRSSRNVANQFEIHHTNGMVFQSYQTTIAVKLKSGEIYLDPMYKYSQTTSKYCNMFLGMTSAERDKAIKMGIIKIVDLNH